MADENRLHSVFNVHKIPEFMILLQKCFENLMLNKQNDDAKKEEKRNRNKCHTN